MKSEEPSHDNPEATPPPPVEMEINGVLDLHGFRPKDVQSVVEEYLIECRERGLLEVRVIHGKGRGELRRTVEHLVSRLEWVERYAVATAYFGGWGATMVYLKPRAKGSDDVG